MKKIYHFKLQLNKRRRQKNAVHFLLSFPTRFWAVGPGKASGSTEAHLLRAGDESVSFETKNSKIDYSRKSAFPNVPN